MPPLPGSVADKLNVIRRRPVGKGAWRMALLEVMESETSFSFYLTAIGNKYPKDAELQRLVGQAALGSVERLGALNWLQHYKGDSDTNGHTISNAEVGRNGG